MWLGRKESNDGSYLGDTDKKKPAALHLFVSEHKNDS